MYKNNFSNDLVMIENDVFDIAEELKKIDEGYRVFFNKCKNRFEVHHLDCFPTLQLVLPYESLDYRTVYLVNQTRVGRSLNPIDIDKENQELEEKKLKKIKDDAAYAAKQIFK